MEFEDRRTEVVIPERVLQKWQNVVNILAQLIEIPAALIMRLVDKDIEVLVSSHSHNNPYSPGDHEHFLGSGLYCETVLKNNGKLLIPNALKDTNWDKNPDIKLNMISYLGFPIMQPDGEPFGTICVLDNKENHYNDSYERLLVEFRDVVQSQIDLAYTNQVLGNENQRLSDYIEEIRTLRGIIPICSCCKKIRDDSGYWQEVEKYVSHHSDARFSHGICPECIPKQYPEIGDLITKPK